MAILLGLMVWIVFMVAVLRDEPGLGPWIALAAGFLALALIP